MAQRKPDGTRTGGPRKSESRQRQNFVGVRFSRDEYGLLELAAAATGKPMARLLREAFLASGSEGESRVGERAAGWDWLGTPMPTAECVKPEHLEAAAARERYEDLLASIWLYIDWPYVTRQLTTAQKELFADAVDAHGRRVAEREGAGWGEPTAVDRWWRDA